MSGLGGSSANSPQLDCFRPGAASDAHRPAVRAFIQWHRDAARDPKALPKHFEDWENKTMHAAPQPEAPPNQPICARTERTGMRPTT